MGSLKKYIVNVLGELVAIPSVNPPGNEKMIAERVSAFLEESGIAASVDVIDGERANVVGLLRGEHPRPILVLNGHLDTVPVKDNWDYPPFEATIENDRMFGLGAADMKGGIASMLGAAKVLAASNEKLKGTLMLTFVADEERKNLGTLRFLENYRDIDYAVIGEPTNLHIVTTHRGVMRFRICTFGRAAHASNPSHGENAIYKMNEVIHACMSLEKRYHSVSSSYVQRPSLSITGIKGGTAENIVPDTCEIIIDRRTVPAETAEEIEESFRTQLEEIKKKDKEFNYSLEILTAVNAWKVRDDSVLLRYGIEAYGKCFGRNPELRDLGATCEATLFAQRGIDTIVFGPGNILAAHTKNEFIRILQLEQAAEYYRTLTKEVLS